jgi:hypothetical protein
MNGRERRRRDVLTEIRAWTLRGESAREIGVRLYLSERQVFRYRQLLRVAGRLP